MSELPRRERTLELPRSAAAIRREQAEEIEQHIAMRAAELVAAGLAADAARAQAEREFGDSELLREQLYAADARTYRSERRRLWLADLRSDFRFALRSLRRAPGFTLVVLVTLTLAMGATTSIFSVFNAYLLRPLPFPASDRLVIVNDEQPNYGEAPASFAEFEDWTQLAGPFDALAAIARKSRNYEGSEYAERVRVAMVSDGFFDLTALRLLAGRRFTTAEQQEGAAPTVVLTESFWRTRLNADPGVIGGAIRLDGEPVTVVGVVADPPQLWPGDPLVAFEPLGARATWRDRGTHYLTVWGRLRAGVSEPSANAALATHAAALQQEHDTDHGIRVVPLRDLLVGDTRPLFLIILGTVVLVLIIACANVANLMLARAARREHEFALRAALGAGRMRIARLLLVEGLTLSALGGIAGLAVGWLGARGLLGALPDSMPRPALVTLDPRVLGFAALSVLGATLLFAMAPILVELRDRLSPLLRSARGGADWSVRSKRTRYGLVILELALSMVLLAGAALMVRSFVRLMRVDPGIEPEGVIAFSVNLPQTPYDSPERRALFFAELEQRLGSLPGVEAVGAAANLPLSGAGMNGYFYIDGTPEDAVRSQPLAEKRIVTPHYFRALGIRLVRGRLFTPDDRAGQPNVVIINEALARTMWPGQDPIGRRIRSLVGEDEWEQIIGIVSDVRSNGLEQSPPLEILYPFAQHVSSGMVMIVRSDTDPAVLVPQLRAAVTALDPQQPIFNIQVMSDVVSQTVAGKRLLLLLATALGALALILAAVGTAGIIAYGVARRTREIGVRVALGARAHEVLQLIMGEALRLAAAGIIIGMGGALLMGQALRSQLFEISPTDGVAYLGAVLTLLAAAALAAYLPARRALRIDAQSALRAD